MEYKCRFFWAVVYFKSVGSGKMEVRRWEMEVGSRKFFAWT
jgi:hypothetical protein